MPANHSSLPVCDCRQAPRYKSRDCQQTIHYLKNNQQKRKSEFTNFQLLFAEQTFPGNEEYVKVLPKVTPILLLPVTSSQTETS